MTIIDVIFQTDFSDLPFDMPKLRRRRVIEQDSAVNRRLQESDACTSGSATSVDLRDLPFDMPKLRRRLRPPALSESQASSSQSVAEQSSGGSGGEDLRTEYFYLNREFFNEIL